MVVEFEEVIYGMLMMVLCDREGRIYDVWISFGSMHEVRAFRERKKKCAGSMYSLQSPPSVSTVPLSSIGTTLPSSWESKPKWG